MTDSEKFSYLLSTLFKKHGWHGVSPGDRAPHVVRASIEITPSDSVKLELDKATGYLHVDRPQYFSSLCPMLYGFIPQTYCNKRVGRLAARKTSRRKVEGDLDPLDICVLSEKNFGHGELLVNAIVIGGLRMIDKGAADDKILAVLENDVTFGHIRDIKDLPKGVVDRLCHYFLSYKRPPSETSGSSVVQIEEVYGPEDAFEVIRLSMEDYTEKYGTEADRLEELRQLLVSSLAAGKKPKKSSPKKRSSKKKTGTKTPAKSRR